jgi:predicted DNA-binding transcriptional regulator AlpA
MRKRQPTKANANQATSTMPAPANPPDLIMAARLSKRLGVSDVTLWRWRHDERAGFPKGRLINRRVYFPWHEVAAWLERQQQVA